MINRFRSSAAIFAATVILTGCGSSSSSSRSSGGSLPGSTAGFPGGTVEANYLADDGKAFSPAGQIVALPLRMFWNRSNNNAIGIFATNPYVAGQNPIALYAAWFDGTVWHAPVEIHGQNEDADTGLAVPMVLWINTTGNTNTAALARNGDAIILYTRADAEPAVFGDEDSNIRLYGTYFDVSAANAATSGTIQGGFDTLARVLDFDNVVVASNLLLGGDDEDVTGFAFASDSLVGTHALSGGNLVDSGDLTTFVHLLYRKDPTSGDPVAADVVGARWWSIPFDLTQATNTLPVAVAANVLPLATGLDTAATAETVGPSLTVHNGHAFVDVTGVVQAPGGNDTALMAYAFGTGATTVFEVNSTRQTGSQDVASVPAAANVYGADHGLASTLFFFQEDGFQDTGANGARSANRDHMLGELRVAAGVTTVGTGSPVDVDGTQAPIDTTNADGDGIPVRAGTTANSPGNVLSGDLQTRINRSGTAIVALWRQQSSDVSDFDDSAATGAGVGAYVPNQVPFVTAVQTRLDSADLRLLSASVATVGTSVAFVSTETTTTAGAGFQEGVANLKFQEGLAGGQAVTQTSVAGALNVLPCDRGSTFQGNHLRMSFLYTQASDQTSPGLDPDNIVLYLNGVTITLGATPTTAPSIALTNTTLATARVDEVHNDLTTGYFAGFTMENGDFLAVDAGDASGTAAAGRVLVFFPSNGNNELEPTATSFDEQRLYVSEQTATGAPGAKVQVSTDPATSFQPNATQHLGLQGLMVVPVNPDTINAPNHVGARTHLFWVEERNVPGSSFGNGRRLATRSYDQADTTATSPAVALGDRFVPALPTGAGTGAPNYIDLSSSGDLLAGFFGATLRGGRNGETVGVYFDEDGHLYYNETTGAADGYPRDVSGPDPALIDNDASFAYDLDTYNVLFPPVGNNLARSQVTFDRFDSANFVTGASGTVGGATVAAGSPVTINIATGGLRRIFVRSHN